MVLGATQIVVGALDVLLVAAAIDLLQAGDGLGGSRTRRSGSGGSPEQARRCPWRAVAG
ncbi:MAG: hypothetical protein U0838_13550 [Chloroflexota bacterium]